MHSQTLPTKHENHEKLKGKHEKRVDYVGKKTKKHRKHVLDHMKKDRMKSRRDSLHHVWTNPLQNVGIEKFGNNRDCCRGAISSNGKIIREVKFDNLPSESQLTHAKRRNTISDQRIKIT